MFVRPTVSIKTLEGPCQCFWSTLSDFTSFSSAVTVDFEQVNGGWEVTSDPKNLCCLLLLENVVSQSCVDFYHEAKKLQI